MSSRVAVFQAVLRRGAGRRALTRQLPTLVAICAVALASRPLLWALGPDTPVWVAPARALVVGAVVGMIGASWCVWIGRRRGPTLLGTAREIDRALNRPELVASGLSFEARAPDSTPTAILRRVVWRQALNALGSVDAGVLFPLPPLLEKRRVMARYAWLLAGGLAVACYDPVVIGAMISPPGEDEVQAARALERAVPPSGAERPEPPELGARSGGADRKPNSDLLGQDVRKKVRDAAVAARRGDRRGALDSLSELRAHAAAEAREGSALGDALREISDAMEQGSNKGSRFEPSAGNAAEKLGQLANQIRSGDAGALGRGQGSALERLSRALSGADRAKERGVAGADDLANELRGAKQALERGERESAARSLEAAARQAQRWEGERATSGRRLAALEEVLRRSGQLEQALERGMLPSEGGDGDVRSGNGSVARSSEGDGQLGRSAGEGQQGKPGGDGQLGRSAGEGQLGRSAGEGQQGKPGGDGQLGRSAGASGFESLRRALASRLMALRTGADQRSAGGTDDGGHVADEKTGRGPRLAAQRDAFAATPDSGGEGRRAVAAIQGLGRGLHPHAYRELFPSYDAEVEEGLSDERVPAGRRRTVRRYFESIRPHDGT